MRVGRLGAAVTRKSQAGSPRLTPATMAGVATPRGSAGRDEALLRRLGGGEHLSDVAASQGWTIE